MMSRYYYLLLLLIINTVLTGCGQPGALYLPAKSPTNTQSINPTQTP